MKTTTKNQLSFLLFCILIGAFAGAVVYGFLRLVSFGTDVLWEWIPAKWNFVWYPLLICGIGGLTPAVLFSGEHQMGVLIGDYLGYLPIALIGFAFLKIILTNLCIQCGLKGGHFFPLIFAGVTMGYGLALIVFPDGGPHVVFAAAIVTASLLGNSLKKPLAVTMLLFLCFPLKMFIWIFFAAVIGSKLAKKQSQ